MQLESAASPAPQSPGLRLQIPNPFDPADGSEADKDMPTVSPVSGGQRVAAAPAPPQPPRFAGRTMQDRRDFMRQYETYLTAINALQTQWGGAFAMPVGACIESKTKRMVARYEFNLAPHLVGEEQWIEYFKQANAPSHVDYASVDEAMKKLRMKTTWPEPESRMMSLQADLETILDQFNLTELAFDHEQRRIVKYLANALAPPSFKSVIVTKLTLQENKSALPKLRQHRTRRRKHSNLVAPVGVIRVDEVLALAEAGVEVIADTIGLMVAAKVAITKTELGQDPPVAPVAAGNDPRPTR
ncbi:hypothetical protein PR001_g20931 [Phytophthora rubi]|nr:hypothetical protein PR001_g20931 [Phytophthora rubi]